LFDQQCSTVKFLILKLIIQPIACLQFVIAAILAVAAAAPSSYPTEEKTYEKDYKYPEITVTSQSDERNLDGSSKWK
jgi:hypothetical protein